MDKVLTSAGRVGHDLLPHGLGLAHAHHPHHVLHGGGGGRLLTWHTMYGWHTLNRHQAADHVLLTPWENGLVNPLGSPGLMFQESNPFQN